MPCSPRQCREHPRPVPPRSRSALAIACLLAVTLGYGEGTAAAVGFTAAGTLAFAGVAAHSDGLPLPLLLWSVATVLSYVLAFRQWRTDRRDSLAYERATQARHEEHRHVETVEVIRARATVEVAQAGGTYATALAAALTARAALPGFDPAALTAAGLPELPKVADEI